MMMGWDWGWSGGPMFFGGLMMLLFWGGLIALIVLAIRALSSGSSGRNTQSHDQGGVKAQQPLEILQVRYAKGEISKQEYEVMRQELLTT